MIPISNEELKDLVFGLNEKTEVALQSLAEEHKKTEAALQSFAEERKKTEQVLKDSHLRTEKQIKATNKQIGDLGNKFGWFTEGLAIPAMNKILEERFFMEYVSPRAKKKIKHPEKGTIQAEYDMMGYANSTINRVYIVEIKSKYTTAYLEKFILALEKFPLLFPEHQEKELYGILSVIDIQEDEKKEVFDSGFYLALSHDDTFQIIENESFQPKNFRRSQLL